MEKIAGTILIAVLGFGMVCLIALMMALPVMWLVNAVFAPSLIVSTVGSTALGFWQALGLNIICGILFRTSCSSSKD